MTPVTRLLIDENVSPAVAEALRLQGHDAVHVNEVGLHNTPDAVIMLWAAQQQRTVVTHDRDYVDNLRSLRAASPSVIKLVQRDDNGLVGTLEQTAHLPRALPDLDQRLARGSLVVMDRTGIVASPLPLAPGLRRRPPELGPELRAMTGSGRTSARDANRTDPREPTAARTSVRRGGRERAPDMGRAR